MVFSNANRMLLLVFVLPLLIAIWLPQSSIHVFCDNQSLEEQVVLITGASSGVGRQLAFQYAKRGASLILVARRQRELDETVSLCDRKLSRRIATVIGDLADEAVTNRVVASINNHFNGKLNLAIMNHAVVPGFLISDEDYEAEFKKTMDINFYSIVRLTRALKDILVRNKGKVVTIGTGGQYVPQMFLSAYGVSKQAVEAFMDHFRVEQAVLGQPVQTQHIVLGEVDTEQYTQKKVENGMQSITMMMLSAEDAARRIMCVAARDTPIAYVPFPLAFLGVGEGLLRPLWTWATWNLWIKPRPEYLERTLKEMEKSKETDSNDIQTAK